MRYKVFHDEFEFFDYITNHKGQFKAKQKDKANSDNRVKATEASLDLSKNVKKEEELTICKSNGTNSELWDTQISDIDAGAANQAVKEESMETPADVTIDETTDVPNTSAGTDDQDGNQGSLNVSLEEGSQDIVTEKTKSGEVVYTCNVCHSFKKSLERTRGHQVTEHCIFICL